MTTAVLLRSGMTRKCHVPFCRAVGGATLSLTLIIKVAGGLSETQNERGRHSKTTLVANAYEPLTTYKQLSLF